MIVVGLDRDSGFAEDRDEPPPEVTVDEEDR
jgi:hypothetical protein